jgi:hypothetical protein
MAIANIAVGRAPPHDVNVIVEIPQGGEGSNMSSTRNRGHWWSLAS